MDAIWYTNEVQETISLAEKLGEKELLIVFEKHDKKNTEYFEAISSKVKLKKALFVHNAKDAQKYGKDYDVLIGMASRDCIESRLIDFVCCAENLEGKDKTHHRMGLNQVLAKLIAERKSYVFSLESLLTSGNKAQVLGRMRQNKTVLTKYDSAMECWSFARSPLDLRVAKERKYFLTNM